MTPRGETYDARLREHLEILRGSRKTPQKKLAEALGGVNASQVTRRLDGTTAFKPREVAAWLDVLGIDHGEFFHGVAGGFHAEVYLARIAGDHDRQKKYADTDLIADGPSRAYTADELRELAAGLRDLRIADPEAARVRALDILRTAYHYNVDPGVEVRFEAAIGLAAVYRLRGGCGTAATFLLQALHLAGDRGRMKARVLHESVPLAGDLGDFEAGLQAAALALSEFARIEDFQGQGRVLVSKGILLWHSGQLDEAAEAYSNSLQVLSKDRWYNRFGAVHGLGLCFFLKGDLSKALKYADRSVAVVNGAGVPILQQAAARFLRGEILLKMGSSEGISELKLALALHSKESANNLEVALISLRLACAYHDHGRIKELENLTAKLVPLLEKLKPSNKLLHGALAELSSKVVRAGLSREALQRIHGALLSAGRNRIRPALLTQPWITENPPGSTVGNIAVLSSERAPFGSRPGDTAGG